MLQTSVRHIERDVNGVAVNAYFTVTIGRDIYWQNTDGTFARLDAGDAALFDLNENASGPKVSVEMHILLTAYLEGLSADVCRTDLLSKCGHGFIAIRKALSITQDDIAAVSGYAVGTISRYERGVYGMKLETSRAFTDTINAILKARGCSFKIKLDDLFPVG